MAELTPAGFLFFRALLGGKTGYGESKKSFTLNPTGGETVLVFKTDTPEFRHHFGIGQDEKASDAMVLYLAPAAPRLALFFVELKGGDHGTAVKQLKRVIRAVKEKLPPNLGRDFLAEVELFPVIVSDRASPRDQKRAEEDFSRDTGLALRTVTKGSVDLRYLLEQPSKRRR